MKHILIGAILLFLAVNGFAQVSVEPLVSDPATLAQINVMSQELKQLRTTVEALPGNDELDSSFAQLDKKIDDSAKSNTESTWGFVVFALILNDILLIAGLIFLKHGLVEA